MNKSVMIVGVGGQGTLLASRILGGAMMGVMSDGGISRIPPWLSAAAVFFAIVIGMLAGLFPALRAMRLSPLAAIRNE